MAYKLMQFFYKLYVFYELHNSYEFVPINDLHLTPPLNLHIIGV